MSEVNRNRTISREENGAARGGRGAMRKTLQLSGETEEELLLPGTALDPGSASDAGQGRMYPEKENSFLGALGDFIS